MRITILVLVLTTFLSAYGQHVKILPAQGEQKSEFLGWVDNEIVVKFKTKTVSSFNSSILSAGRTGVAVVDQLNQQFQATQIKRLFPNARPQRISGREFDLSTTFKIKFAQPQDVEALVQKYKALNNEVIYAQPIGLHSVCGTPNDPQFGMQWHLNRLINDADVDAPEAWDYETGDTQIILAMIDTGVRYYHKDLGGKDAAYNNFTYVDGDMWVNWTEKNGVAGVDDDSNGYVDDWIGYDFVDNAPTSGLYRAATGEDGDNPDNDPRDFNGHGTHCAGNLAALNNNGMGLCAVTGGWGNGTQQRSGNGVKVIALRNGYQTVLGLGIVQMDAAAQGLIYAADNGARIASCSWGTSNSGGIAEAADYFLAQGGLIFHAAGNDAADSPSYFDQRGDIISVAATDSTDNGADFTNYGTWVDISAPGTGIWSLGHNHDDDANDYIQRMDGTSMATPIAASVAALIWSQHPDWTAEQVKQRLYDTADDIEAELDSQFKGKMGAGRVNAFNAVYQENNGIIGDVNEDSAANSTDALIILSCDVGLDTSQFCPMNCGDANMDGFVNSTDALIILSYDVGLSVPYNVGQSGCNASVTPCAGCEP